MTMQTRVDWVGGAMKPWVCEVSAMATLTPLNQQSLSAPERGRDDARLHWGAALGALVLASATVGSVVGLFLQGAVFLDDWLGQGVAWEVTYRFTAATSLVAAAAVAVTAMFVLADTAPLRVLSWAAVAVAVLAWLSATPWWWEVAGGYAPFWFPVDSTQLVAVWLVLVGADAWGGGTWHRWLGAVTVLAGVAAGVGVMLGFMGVVAVNVWAVVFAVAQLAGPHPAAGAGPAGKAVGATAASTPGHDTGVTARTGRWQRTPGAFVRLLSGVGPPVAVAITFLIGWQAVSQWPEAPSGDTSFAWMPGGTIIVCGLAALVGLAVLAVRTARAAVACSTVFWLSTAWLYPAAFVEDGFPQSAKATMVGLSMISLLPTAIVWGWAAFGHAPAAPPSAQHPRAVPMSEIWTDPASQFTGTTPPHDDRPDQRRGLLHGPR